MNNDQTVRLLDATSRIVAAYISRPEINLNDLPVIMEDVYKLMTRLITAPAAFVSGRRPAVPIDESIHDDYLVCLEDGRHLSMLKRHLKTTYGLTVEEYKERWGLPKIIQPLQQPIPVDAEALQKPSDLAKQDNESDVTKPRILKLFKKYPFSLKKPLHFGCYLTHTTQVIL